MFEKLEKYTKTNVFNHNKQALSEDYTKTEEKIQHSAFETEATTEEVVEETPVAESTEKVVEETPETESTEEEKTEEA